MFWADKIEKELSHNEIINDSKTPSGRVHVGSLRGVILHYIIWKVLTEAGKNPTFMYGIDDYDPVDDLPHDISKEYRQYMGMPLCNVPSPEEAQLHLTKQKSHSQQDSNLSKSLVNLDGTQFLKADSSSRTSYPSQDDDILSPNFADYYMNEFLEVFKSLGIKPTLYKMSDFYKSGKMNEVIEIVLNHEDIIREIYLSVSGSKKPKSWHPFQVVCERCQKIGTTLVHSFDGQEVEYTCEPNMVKWAKGCDYRGKVSPFNGKGKLPWKLEWVGKWKILGVTVEGAGKDHSSEGGSRDVSSEIFRQVFDGKPPYNIPYEFFLTGKKKMSSSKGLGSSSKEIASLIPPELLRFLMIRYPPNAVIDFNPFGDTIPRLFDEYDRCGNLFFNREGDRTSSSSGVQNGREQGKDQSESLERAFELAQLDDNGKKTRFYLRFSLLATLIQIPSVDLKKKIKEMKHEKISEIDINELELRKVYAEKWLQDCASDAHKFHITEELSEEIKSDISILQRDFIKELIPIFEQKGLSGEEIHQKVYETTQIVGIKPAEGFKTIYQLFIGKQKGPRIGTFLAALDPSFVKKRFEEIF